MNSLMNIQITVLARQAVMQIRSVQTQMAALERQTVRANAASNATAKGGLASMSAATLKAGSRMQWMGRQLQYNFTIPILLAGGAALKWALDNEKAMTRVRKVYGDGTQSAQQMKNELNALGHAFEELSNHFGIAQSDAINIAADWAAAGSSGVALARAVKLTMETMVLGELSATEATQALIAIQAQYNQSTLQLSRTIDTLNMIENQTGISMAGLVQGFARAAGVARSAGVDVLHLGAFLAALVPASGGAAQAGNALKTIISRLLAPTEEARQIMGAMNISIDDLSWKSLNATQRIELMAGKFVKLKKAQQGQVSATLASRYQINKFDVLMRDVASHAGYYQKALDSAGDADKNFAQKTRELNQVLESNPQKFKQVGVIIKNSMADVIVPLIPYIVYLAQKFKDLVQGFSNMNPVVQKFILLGLAMVAMLGIVVRYIGAFAVMLHFMHSSLGILLAPLKLIGVLFRVFFLVGPIGTLLKFFQGMLIVTAQRIVLVAFAMSSVWAKMAGMFIAATGMMTAQLGRFIALWLGRMVVFWNVQLAGEATFAAKWVALKALALAKGMALDNAVWAWTKSKKAAFLAWSFALDTAFFARARAAKAAFLAWGVALDTSVFAWMKAKKAAFLAWSLALDTAFFAKSRAMRAGFWAWTRALDTAFFAWAAAKKTAFLAWGFAVDTAAFAAMKSMRAGFFAWARALDTAFFAWAAGKKAAFLAWSFALDTAFFARAKAAKAAFLAWSLAVDSAFLATSVGKWLAVNALLLANTIRTWAMMATAAVIPAITAMIAWMTRGMLATILFMLTPANFLRVWTAGWLLMSKGLGAALSMMKGMILRFIPFMFGPWGIAIGAVLGLLYIFRDKIGGWVRSIVEKFKQLPSSIAAIFKGVVAIVKAAVMAVYHLLQYLNPFAHHSPSLVENVTAGVDLIARKYASLKNVGQYFRQAGADLAAFGKATAQANALYEQGQINEQRKEVAKADPGALPAFDKLARDIPLLQRALGALQVEFTKQSQVVGVWKARLDAADARLDASRKKLDTLQKAADAAQNKLAGMNGELEVLRGTQESLRQAGAGSDILGPLAKDIEKVQGAADAISGPNGPIAQAAAQQLVVDKIEAQRDAIAARYDLEQKKLDQIRDAYDAITGRIEDMTDAMGQFAQRSEEANRAAKAAHQSPGLKNFLGAAGGDFADVGGNAKIGREGLGLDQSAEIDKFTKDLAAQTAGMFGDIDLFGPIRKMWDRLWNWMKINVMPKVQPVIDSVKQAFQNTDWGDIGARLRGAWDSIVATVTPAIQSIIKTAKRLWDIFGPDLTDIFFALRDAAVQIWTDIGPTIMPFIKAVGRLIRLIAILLIPVIKLASSILAKTLGPILKFVISIIADIIEFVTGLINVVVGLLTGDWKLAWEGAKQIVTSIVGAIWHTIRGVFQLIWGIVKWIVMAIVGFFKWLWGVLVGHSIIPDIISGIWYWFKKLLSLAKWIWDNVLKPVWGFFKSLWTNYLYPIVSGLWGWIKGAFKGLMTMGKWFWDNVLSPVVTLFKNIWGKISGPLGTFARNVGDIFNGIGKAIIGGINLGIDAINGLIQGLNWIGSHVPGLSFHIDQIDHVGVKKAAASAPAERDRHGQLLAAGGQVGEGFRTNGPRAIVGEGRRAYPEYVIPTDPRYRNNAMRLLYGAMSDIARDGRASAARSNIGRHGDGFLAGGIPDPRDILDKGGDLAGKALGVIRKGAVIAAFAGPLAIANQAIGKMPNGMHQRDLMNGKKNQIYNWAKGVDAKGAASGAVLGGSLPKLSGQSKLTVLSRAAGGSATILHANAGSSNEYHFHGNLEFPNIKSGADAEEFVRNLESLVG